MNRNITILLYGLIVWLVPFLLSIPFYSPAGQPLYDLHLIKSILIIVGATTGAILALRYFRDVKGNFTREGAIIGIAWFAISSALDILVLAYLLHGMDLATWAGQIGIRYLLIPIMTMAMAAAMEMRGE